MPEVCEFVLVLMTAASEDEAVSVWAFTAVVPAAIAEPMDEYAVSVCALTALVMPEVCVSVCAFTFVVPVVMAEPSEDEALVTSDWSASEPLESPAPVRVRVADVHTSAARVPKFESVRLV